MSRRSAARAARWDTGPRGFSWKQPGSERLQRESRGFGAETGLQGYGEALGEWEVGVESLWGFGGVLVEEKGEGMWAISSAVRSGVQLSAGGAVGMRVAALQHRE